MMFASEGLTLFLDYREHRIPADIVGGEVTLPACFKIVLEDDLDIVLLLLLMEVSWGAKGSLGKVTCHLEAVAGVFSLFDEPVYPRPVLLVAGEFAGQGVEPEFHHGIDDRGGIVPSDEALDIFAELERLPLFYAEEVLLVLDDKFRNTPFKKGYVFLYPHVLSGENYKLDRF